MGQEKYILGPVYLEIGPQLESCLGPLTPSRLMLPLWAASSGTQAVLERNVCPVVRPHHRKLHLFHLCSAPLRVGPALLPLGATPPSPAVLQPTTPGPEMTTPVSLWGGVWSLQFQSQRFHNGNRTAAAREGIWAASGRRRSERSRCVMGRKEGLLRAVSTWAATGRARLFVVARTRTRCPRGWAGRGRAGTEEPCMGNEKGLSIFRVLGAVRSQVD